MRWTFVVLLLALAACARGEYRPVAFCSTLELANKEPCPERELNAREIGWRDLN